MTITLPYTFVDGVVADADQVMADLDAIIAGVPDLSDPTALSAALVTPSGGNTPRALARILADYSGNVMAFGAKGDGTTDDTTSINGAIAYYGTTGGEILFPPGKNFKVTGTISIPYNGILLTSPAMDSGFITLANGAVDGISFDSATGGGVSKLRIDTSGKTGGNSVKIASSSQVNLEDLLINNSYYGIELYATNTISINRVNLNGITGAGGYGIKFWADVGAGNRCDVLQLADVVINGSTGAVGMNWQGPAYTVTMHSVRMLSCSRGLWVRNETGDATNYPAFLEAHGLEYDGGTGSGLYISCGAQFKFFDCDIYSSSADHAVQILKDTGAGGTTTRGVQFFGGRIGNCLDNGVYCEAQDVHLYGVNVNSCSQDGSGLWSGVRFTADANGCRVIGGNCGAIFGELTLHKYGVEIEAGASDIAVIGVDCPNCVTDGIGVLSSDSHIFVVANRGLTVNRNDFGDDPYLGGRAGDTNVFAVDNVYLNANNANVLGALSGGGTLLVPSALPLTGQAGEVRYDSGTDRLKAWDGAGAAWKTITWA